jgi:hypothetical protein
MTAKLILSIGLGATILFAGACGASPQNLSNKTNRQALSGEQAQQHGQLVAEADALWSQRGDRAKLQGALAKWEQAIGLKDDDWNTYAKLARGYYFYADAFLAFDAMSGGYPYDPDGVKDQKANDEFLNTHLRGIEHAEKGLAAVSEPFEKRVLSGIRAEDAVVVIDRTGIELVYWYASNLGKWAKAKGFSTVLKHKDRIFKMVSHVYKTAPDYFHGAADRYFGAFYAVAPAFAGGDLDKSKSHFEATMAAAPKYLGSYVLAAELYTTKAQAPESFDQFLQVVMTTPADALPEVAPENEVEKRKAQALLAKKAELF